MRKAFDTLSHTTIVNSLRFYGVDDTTIAAILREIRGNDMELKTTDGHKTKPIKQLRGVRQGGSLSPLLFVLALNFILFELYRSWQARGFGFLLCDGTRLCALAFADDILLIASTWEEMQIMMTELANTLSLHGLDIQPEKCCAMGNRFAGPPADILLRDIIIKNTSGADGFVFLGTLLTIDGSCILEVRARIASAWRTFWRLRRYLLNRGISTNKRLEFWMMTIRPSLFWAAGSWRLTSDLCSEITKAQRSMFRKISMKPRLFDDTAWDYMARSARALETWLTKTKHDSWENYGLKQAWSWAGHVARLPAGRLARKVLHTDGAYWRTACQALDVSTSFFGKFGVRRRLRWENTIQQFCFIELMDTWCDIATNKGVWETKMTAYVNFVHLNWKTI
jgi:hypothetical protein